MEDETVKKIANETETVKRRSNQTAGMKSVNPMPESVLSGQKGTAIVPSSEVRSFHFFSLPERKAAFANAARERFRKSFV